MPSAVRVVELPNLAATELLARSVAAHVGPSDAILLEGPLGVGKTAFARAILRDLTGDATLDVPSPSFTLVQTYATRAGPVHHFDLWRLDGPGRLTELGWEDALTDIVLVEWPERLGDQRPSGALAVTMEFADGEGRRARLDGWPDRAIA